MAKKRTEKCNYPSRYSPSGWVTVNQYIAERLCEEKAKREGDGELPINFWNIKEWADYYKGQLRAISKLLKKYHAKAIIAAIKEKRLFTLRPAWVETHIINKNKCVQSIPDDIKLREIVENPTIREDKDNLSGKFGDL